jgi:hypothetical protein
VLATVGATAPRGRLSRRPRPTELEPGAAPEPGSVPVTRASVVFAALSADAAPDDEALARQALAALNRVVRAHRLAAADPHVREATPNDAIALRVGHASGEQAAEGRLAAGRELPLEAPRRRRAAMLSPVERSAALLARREEPLVCEELVLRARLDLDAGRRREAALEAETALRAALAELAPGAEGDLATRLAELGEEREPLGAIARAAATAPLSDEQTAALEHALGRLEALLRARQAGR